MATNSELSKPSKYVFVQLPPPADRRARAAVQTMAKKMKATEGVEVWAAELAAILALPRLFEVDIERVDDIKRSLEMLGRIDRLLLYLPLPFDQRERQGLLAHARQIASAGIEVGAYSITPNGSVDFASINIYDLGE
jgi:hypothetical protein